MSPTKLDRLLGRLAVQKPVDEAGGKAISTTNTIVNVQLTRGCINRLAIHPRHRAPAVTVRRMHLTQCGRNDLDARMTSNHMLNHRQERAGIQLGTCRHLRTREPETLLQILLVAHQHINVIDNRPKHLMSPLHPTHRLPQLLPVVQVERANNSSSPGGLHRFDHQLRRSLRQRSEDSPAVKPPNTLGEYRLPVEITRLQQRRSFVAAVIKHNRSANPKPLIAVHRRNIRSARSIMLESLIERTETHSPHPLGDQIANRIGHHCRRDSCTLTKSVGQIRGNIELAAAHMDCKLRSLAERNDTRIETMHHRTEGKQIERPLLRNFEAKTHDVILLDPRCLGNEFAYSTGLHLDGTIHS